MLKIAQCKVCHRHAPLGLDEHPVFSWVLESGGQNVYQAAYEIKVYQDENLLWVSHRVESRESLAAAYEGPTLTPCTVYHVHVTVWDTQGRPVFCPVRSHTRGFSKGVYHLYRTHGQRNPNRLRLGSLL